MSVSLSHDLGANELRLSDVSQIDSLARNLLAAGRQTVLLISWC